MKRTRAKGGCLSFHRAATTALTAAAFCLSGVLTACSFDETGLSEPDTNNTNHNNVCGDGIIAGADECDDENSRNGDGCSDMCQIEPGHTCTGEPSTCQIICGDGLIYGSETCDDGAQQPGDGCNENCQIEPGYRCSGQPSECQASCGDGQIIAPEACDDANIQSGDGCSATCEVEPGYTCAGEPSVCESLCGDSAVTPPESCDDGNLADGDGCAADCQVETGWECTGQPSYCQPICSDGLLRGNEQCDDGNLVDADGCSADCLAEDYYTCVGEPSHCVCRYLVNATSTTPSPDGLIWPTAFTRIQDAIDAAAAAVPHVETCEVWVAEGTYHVYETAPNDTVSLASNVALYGGFLGTETNRFQRDCELNQTTLDGSDGNAASVAHVLTAIDTQDATLDGFIVRGGQTAQNGGGLYAQESAISIANTIFTANSAYDGAALYASGGSLFMLNSSFVSNIAMHHGGGIALSNVSAVSEYCRFVGNTAGLDGGGAYSFGAAQVEHRSGVFSGNVSNRGAGIALTHGNVSKCRIHENASHQLGGGLYVAGTATVANTVFWNNSARWGAGAFNGSSAIAVYVNATFHGNIASDSGGAVNSNGGDTELTNSIIWGNLPNGLSGHPSTTQSVTYSNVQESHSGVGNLQASPEFSDAQNADFRLTLHSPCVDAADGDAAPLSDITGSTRVDISAIPNTGSGVPPYADIGAHELQP